MKGLVVILCCLFFLSDKARFQPSPNGHCLLRNGKVFFWLGDTGWELFHRLTREQADQYLKIRSSQGFTVIQAVVLAEFDGLHAANAYGDIPLLNDDPSTPNENYFKHVDYIINKTAEEGLVIGLLPTRGDKVTKSGACGHTYGCHDIWQFYSKEREPVNGPHFYWTAALQLTGANQMKYIRRLIESHPLTDRVPDRYGQDWVLILDDATKNYTIN